MEFVSLFMGHSQKYFSFLSFSSHDDDIKTFAFQKQYKETQWPTVSKNMIMTACGLDRVFFTFTSLLARRTFLKLNYLIFNVNNEFHHENDSAFYDIFQRQSLSLSIQITFNVLTSSLNLKNWFSIAWLHGRESRIAIKIWEIAKMSNEGS